MLTKDPSNDANSGDWEKVKLGQSSIGVTLKIEKENFFYNEKLFSLSYSIPLPTCLWWVHNKAYKTNETSCFYPNSNVQVTLNKPHYSVNGNTGGDFYTDF